MMVRAVSESGRRSARWMRSMVWRVATESSSAFLSDFRVLQTRQSGQRQDRIDSHYRFPTSKNGFMNEITLKKVANKTPKCYNDRAAVQATSFY